MTAFGSHASLKALVAGERLPLALVNLDALDANIARIRAIAEAHGKTVRVATKSIRVPDLIRHVIKQGGPAFQGLMCYSAEEIRLLSGLGHDDFLLAYPATQISDLRCVEEVVRAGRRISLMVDDAAQVAALDAFWPGSPLPPLNVCIDVDMSFRPFGGALHLGVLRSPIHGAEAFERLVDQILQAPNLRLAGVMGYEAQVAGLGDRNPFTPLMNPAKRALKRLSVRDVAARRAAIHAVLERRGIRLDYFNGGGSGSLATTSREPWITEVTAGSGFLQSHLFDYYQGNRNEPALCFALQVSRLPAPGVVTCLGGGYVASGEAGPDKLPRPFLPEGLAPVAREGFGEVQTPLLVPPGVDLRPGDPVFFRPAKAGEIAERFTHYLLKRGDHIVERVETYRGLGACFF